jgi:hypothetical protein
MGGRIRDRESVGVLHTCRISGSGPARHRRALVGPCRVVRPGRLVPTRPPLPGGVLKRRLSLRPVRAYGPRSRAVCRSDQLLRQSLRFPLNRTVAVPLL